MRRLNQRYALSALRTPNYGLVQIGQKFPSWYTEKQNLCTMEARRHGEKQKIDELFWISGTFGFSRARCRCFKLYLSSRKIRTRKRTYLRSFPLRFQVWVLGFG